MWTCRSAAKAARWRQISGEKFLLTRVWTGADVQRDVGISATTTFKGLQRFNNTCLQQRTLHSVIIL